MNLNHNAFGALIASASILAGCAHVQKTRPHNRQESNGLVLLDAMYDGQYITGLLIVRGGEKLKLDRRLPESASVEVRYVRRCSGELIAHDVADTTLPSPQEADFVQIGPGFVYGKEVELLVTGHKGPDCIIASIAVVDYGREVPPDAGDAHYRIGEFQF